MFLFSSSLPGFIRVEKGCICSRVTACNDNSVDSQNRCKTKVHSNRKSSFVFGHVLPDMLGVSVLV